MRMETAPGHELGICSVRALSSTTRPPSMTTPEPVGFRVRSYAGAVLEEPLALSTLLTGIRRVTADWV